MTAFGTSVPAVPTNVRFQGVKQPCRRNPETAEFDPELSSGEPPSVSVALVDNVNDPLGQCVAPPGRRTVNTEPLPGSLDTIMSPPIMRVSLRERASPRPVPP
jgi:hypothetical protein